MYLPKSFEVKDLPLLQDFMQQYAFATLVTVAPDNLPFASHISLMLDRERSTYGTLIGHLARANPQWRSFEPDKEILVIFQGPHTYISPSWYQVHPSVPTWNYTAVHAYAKPRLLEGFDNLHPMMGELVSQHEAVFEHQWNFDLPGEYEQKMLQAIVAFELEITRLEGKFKLSQNRSEIDQQNVSNVLAASNNYGDQQVAKLMQGAQQREH